MKQKAESGELILAYVDETGFDAVHPNQYAWSPVGERHLIQADRGSRLNVLGAMISTGQFFCARIWENTNAGLFAGFIGCLSEFVGKPLTVILDNASVHKGGEMKKLKDVFERKGVTFYSLPAYSPELNKIERLWHKMKYTWMQAKRRTKADLEKDVTEIIDGLGSKYQFAFY